MRARRAAAREIKLIALAVTAVTSFVRDFDLAGLANSRAKEFTSRMLRAMLERMESSAISIIDFDNREIRLIRPPRVLSPSLTRLCDSTSHRVW